MPCIFAAKTPAAPRRPGDTAGGKGEFLIRLVEAYGVRGVGLDLSPFFIADAERRLRARVPQAGITFTQMDGADLPELLERVAKEKAVYLRWGRDVLGWALYVFRCPPARGTEAVSGA